MGHERSKPQYMILSMAAQQSFEHSTSYVPERGLLAAVLERAVRDLGERVTLLDRRLAMEWFKGEEQDLEIAITYQFVKAELKLSKADCDFIDRVLHRAEEIQKEALKSKREKLGIKLADVSVLHRN